MGNFLKIGGLKSLSICDLGFLLVANVDHVPKYGAHIFWITNDTTCGAAMAVTTHSRLFNNF